MLEFLKMILLILIITICLSYLISNFFHSMGKYLKSYDTQKDIEVMKKDIESLKFDVHNLYREDYG